MICSRSASLSFASSITFMRILCSVAGTLSQRQVVDQSVPNMMRCGADLIDGEAKMFGAGADDVEDRR